MILLLKTAGVGMPSVSNKRFGWNQQSYESQNAKQYLTQKWDSGNENNIDRTSQRSLMAMWTQRRLRILAAQSLGSRVVVALTEFLDPSNEERI